MLEYRIEKDNAGQRLDKFIRRMLKTVPASHVYKMIRTKKVRVNDKRAQVEQLLQEGDQVSIRGTEATLLGPAEKPAAKAPPPKPRIEFKVLYEDDHIMAVDKPSGLAIHTGSGIYGGTLVDQVREYLGPRAERNGFLASPAHRLDRETSGVVLVAKSRPAMVRFTEMFTEGLPHKTYLALAKGRFAKPQGTIDMALPEHQQTTKSRRERGVNLQLAVTHYRVVAQGRDLALIECTIETGRTHQIRRHLAAIGHPVVGDKRYGDFPYNREAQGRYGLRRLFLHALRIRFDHPVHGGKITVESPLPEELQSVLAKAGLSRAPVDV